MMKHPRSLPLEQRFSSLDERFLTVLKRKTKRWMDREALRMNILAAVQISDTIGSMLGPKGMNKLIYRENVVTFSSDCETFLNEAGVTNPIGRMLVDLAKVQRDQIGDGSTSLVLLTGALLREADKLIEIGIHPCTICSAYSISREKVLAVLDELALKVNLELAVFEKVAGTAMRESVQKHRNIVAKAALHLAKSESNYVDRDMIKIQPQKGRSTADTELIEGIVLKSERLGRAVPRSISNAKIALLDFPISKTPVRTDLKMEIRAPESYGRLHEQEEKIVEDLVEKIHASGATAVFDQKGFEKNAWRYFASRGMFVAKRETTKDMRLLEKACGATLTSTIDDLSADKLGFAEIVEERKFNEEKVVVVEGCKNPQAVTIFARAPSGTSLETLEKELKRSIGAVTSIIEDPRILPGGGASEVELSRRLREYCSGITSRERLGIEAFARAVEEIPISLARNSGLKAADVLVKLKALHNSGQTWAGFDSRSMSIIDVAHAGIYDAHRVKSHMIKLAVDAAISILRIDDVIIASRMTRKEAEERGYEKADH
jgi:chaperonin GroEL (HSP60 family)